MSMTREEAIKWLEEIIQDTDTYWGSCSEALQKEIDVQKEVFLLALSALRPITRERLEKAWGGCYLCRGATKMIGLAYAEGPSEIVKGEKFQAAYVGKFGSDGKDEFCKLRFCPACGRPITDKAVDMVMERLEALRDE